MLQVHPLYELKILTMRDIETHTARSFENLFKLFFFFIPASLRWIETSSWGKDPKDYNNNKEEMVSRHLTAKSQRHHRTNLCVCAGGVLAQMMN